MYWQKESDRVRFGVYLILIGVALFIGGWFVQQYHEFSFTPEGYLRDVSNPLSLVGVGLIIGAVVLFLFGFYLIVKDKLRVER
jgi:drug/metabolite transporter (DMT)-like permease